MKKSSILDGAVLLPECSTEEKLLAEGSTTANKTAKAGAPSSPLLPMSAATADAETMRSAAADEELPESLDGMSVEAKEQAYATLQRILCNPTGGYALHERFRALFALKNIADDQAVRIVAKGRPRCF
jgi:hypothetical protein